jgi:hypothetical protein
MGFDELRGSRSQTVGGIFGTVHPGSNPGAVHQEQELVGELVG